MSAFRRVAKIVHVLKFARNDGHVLAYAEILMRLRPSPEWNPMFDALTRMKSIWPSRGWSWDSRLICMTTSFVGEYFGEARAALKLAFPAEYHHSTITQSHAWLQEIVEKAGGVRAGQVVYAQSVEPVANLFTYALWWPWNDQETVSVRLGFAKLEPNDEPYPRLREIFNVSLS